MRVRRLLYVVCKAGCLVPLVLVLVLHHPTWAQPPPPPAEVRPGGPPPVANAPAPSAPSAAGRKPPRTAAPGTGRGLSLVLLAFDADQPDALLEGTAALPSLLRHVPPAVCHTLFIVLDQRHLLGVNASSSLEAVRHAFHLELLTEVDLLSKGAVEAVHWEATHEKNRARRRSTEGLLALAVAARVPTPFYLTFPARAVLTRPLSLAALVNPAGRAVLQAERRGGGCQPAAAWAAAGALLGAPQCVARTLNQTMAPLPAILSREVSVRLFAALGNRRAADNYLLLLLPRYPWTATALYWTFACKAGLLAQYHQAPLRSDDLQLHQAPCGLDPNPPSSPGQVRVLFEVATDTHHPEPPPEFLGDVLARTYAGKVGGVRSRRAGVHSWPKPPPDLADPGWQPEGDLQPLTRLDVPATEPTAGPPAGAGPGEGAPPAAPVQPLGSVAGSQASAAPPGSAPEPQVSLTLLTHSQDNVGFARLPGLFQSLVKFLPRGLVHTFFIIVPSSDQALFSDPAFPLLATVRRHLPVRILTDQELLSSGRATFDALLPELERSDRGGRGTGYRLQMLLKLLVSRHVQTPFYVTLDSDVFACRPIAYHDLVDGAGRAVVQGEPLEGTRHQRRWWTAAETVLQAPGCVRGQQAAQVVGVTPAVLATAISRGAVAEVERLYSEPFDQHLFKALHGLDWSEYTLYWTYGCKANLLDRLHHPSAGLKVYDSSGFEFGAFARWRPEALFAGRTALFGVLQSIGGAAAAAVNARLLPFLELTAT